MMYLAQIATVVCVFWAERHYDWYDGGVANPYATGLVALFAALLVTEIIHQISLLPSRLARLWNWLFGPVSDRLMGLKDEPGDQITRLPRSSWHRGDTLESRSRLRIGKDSG